MQDATQGAGKTMAGECEDVGDIPHELPVKEGRSEPVPNRKTAAPEKVGALD